MGLKKTVAKKGRELQGAQNAPGGKLKLQPAVVTQQMLQEAYEAQQRASRLQNNLRELLNRGVELERGRYWLHGHVAQCPDCKCCYSEDGEQFHPVDSKLFKPQKFVVPHADCPRCTARELVEAEIANAAKQKPSRNNPTAASDVRVADGRILVSR